MDKLTLNGEMYKMQRLVDKATANLHLSVEYECNEIMNLAKDMCNKINNAHNNKKKQIINSYERNNIQSKVKPFKAMDCW